MQTASAYTTMEIPHLPLCTSWRSRKYQQWSLWGSGKNNCLRDWELLVSRQQTRCTTG